MNQFTNQEDSKEVIVKRTKANYDDDDGGDNDRS